MGTIKDAHKELTDRVMGRKGISGTAIGMAGGKPCLKVYLSGDEVEAAVPPKVGGFPVVVEKAGSFRRL